MRRRQGFTLVELLVAMALIMFMMAILSQAFVSATGVFRNLKAAGDMAEKLRAVTQQLQHDLAADHFEGKKRLSGITFWTYGPPQQGYFQIYQGSPPPTMAGSKGVLEGADPDGITSYRTFDHALAFTIKRRGNQMSDFLSASVPAALRNASANFGPPETRYQSTSGGSYNYQWAEVAWFLQPSLNPATNQQDTTAPDPSTGAAAVPLYTLYRRQRLAVPDNSLVTPALAATAANRAACLEVSCWTDANGNLYFNNPADLTVPGRRFGGGKPTQFTTIAAELQALGQSNPTLIGSDIQLTDVVSFDVRILAVGEKKPGSIDPFVTMYEPPFVNVPPLFFGGYTYTNSLGLPTAARVFDSWTSVHDNLNNYSNWDSSGNAPTSMPLILRFVIDGPREGPTIQALQISIRIWDAKTNQTRQVTIVQAM